MASVFPKISRLKDEAILAVAGRDSRSFLHAQLTQNISDLKGDRHALAAWADARGRVRALYRVVPAGDRWLLVTSADLVAPLLPKLRLFVLRSQVVIEPSDSLQVYAIIGDPGAWQSSARLALPDQTNGLGFEQGVHWLRIAPELIYAIGTDQSVRAACRALDEASSSQAELAAIGLGLPLVDAALTERYIPQMLSLDTLGAIALNKGCYPGQEIITRTHHLGAVKRRLRRFGSTVKDVPARGTTIRAANAAEAGQVIRAAPAARGMELLAVAAIEAPAETLRLDGAPDIPLVDLGLPYLTPRA